MDTKKKISRAPKNIRPEARKLWREVNNDFPIDPEAEQILTVGVISLSRFLRIREVIDKEGETYVTPTGQRKKHPGLEVEKIARQGFLSAMKQLNLDYSDDPPRKPGRPLSDGGAALT